MIQARQNLQAAIARLEKEQTIINEATINLEKARSEEAVARLALQETIAHYTGALPYSIVPNGNGQTVVGTPAGNNPSGSALGSPLNGNGSELSFKVDWTHYLSQAYGLGIIPSFHGGVNTLYNFQLAQNSNIRTDNDCSNNGLIRSVYGNITEVKDTYFVLSQDDGTSMRVYFAPCTQMNANVAGYTMRAGDMVIVKGSQMSVNSMNGQAVTCLAQ